MATFPQVLLVASLLSLVSWPVHAQGTTTPTPTIQPRSISQNRPMPSRDPSKFHPLESPGNKMSRTQARALFSERIKQKLDTKKQDIALKAVDRLSIINTNQTKRLAEAMGRLSQILKKMTLQADSLEKQGTSVTTLRSTINAAQTAVSQAEIAITTQQNKEYTVIVSDSEPVGRTLATTMQQLQSDLQVLRQNSIEPARKSVLIAFQTLASIAKESRSVTKPSPSVSAAPTL